MLGFYPEAMHLLTSKKIRTPDEWLEAIRKFFKKREQHFINEHFSHVSGTHLLIDSKNDKMYGIHQQKIVEYHLSKSED